MTCTLCWIPTQVFIDISLQSPVILATDRDYGVNGTDGIVYSLSGDGSNLFVINPHNGSIYLGDLNLDRERTTSYQLQVIYKKIR